VYGAKNRNAPALAAIVAKIVFTRPAANGYVIQQAITGISKAMPPLYFVAAARPDAAPATAKLRSVPRSCAISDNRNVNATKNVSGVSVRTKWE
jgi:hypothetical protein